MLAARFCRPGDVRVEEVPDPEPGPGDVVIRVRNCSLCGAGRKTIQHGHHRLSPPRVLGHEIAGEVVSTGAEVTGWAAGDRVQVIAAISGLGRDQHELGKAAPAGRTWSCAA